MPAVPNQVLAGDVYVITQGTGAYSINDSLAQNLSAQPWAHLVSPEIFSLGTLNGAAIVVRGVNPVAFLGLEGATWTAPPELPQTWAFAGGGLAARVGIGVGSELTLVGSSIPRLDVVSLAVVYRSSTAANDELLVDYGTARFLTGVGPGVYHSIRVETADPAALVAFLAQRGASAHVTGPGGTVGNANTGPLPADPRVINLFLRYGLGPLPPDYVAEGLAEATNSVQVVAWGLEVLVLLLVALGLHAVQARAFEDRRSVAGVLRALGAPGRWVRLRALREILPWAVVASVLGGAAGLLAAWALAPNAGILAFGHTVPVTFDPLSFALVIGAIVAVSAVSEMSLIGSALKVRPAESFRGRPTPTPAPSLEVVLRD